MDKTMEQLLQGSPVARFLQMDRGDFQSEIEPLWQAAQELGERINALVVEGTIAPVQGLAIIAATTAELFGYRAQHGPVPVTELLATYAGGLTPQSGGRS